MSLDMEKMMLEQDEGMRRTMRYLAFGGADITEMVLKDPVWAPNLPSVESARLFPCWDRPEWASAMLRPNCYVDESYLPSRPNYGRDGWR